MYKRIFDDPMLLKYWDCKWYMLLDYPIDERLVGMLRLTVVGDCKLNRWCSSSFRHLDGYV